MKKVIFSALILLCITATGAWAQKGNAEQPTETGATSTSTAREGKNVGKGSPMIQRNASGTGVSKASEAPSDAAVTRSAVAPAAPSAAPVTKTAPASEAAPVQAPANNSEAHPDGEHKSNKILPVLVAPPASNEGQKE